MHHLVSLQKSTQLKFRAERERDLCEDPFPEEIIQVLNAVLWMWFRTIDKMSNLYSVLCSLSELHLI